MMHPPTCCLCRIVYYYSTLPKRKCPKQRTKNVTKKDRSQSIRETFFYMICLHIYKAAHIWMVGEGADFLSFFSFSFVSWHSEMIITTIFDPVVILTFSASAILFGSWFTLWYKKNLARTERERAYVCCLISSSLSFACSIPLTYKLLTNGGDLAEILAYRTWTVVVTAFFMSFLVVDLVIGVVFYRSKIELLTGWIHHITYLCLLTWSIRNQFTSGFVMMCTLELPTFILALGSVRSQLRRDYIFAATFLATRIFFHAYAIKCAWVMKPYGPVVTALLAFFPVHCFWFYGI